MIKLTPLGMLPLVARKPLGAETRLSQFLGTPLLGTPLGQSQEKLAQTFGVLQRSLVESPTSSQLEASDWRKQLPQLVSESRSTDLTKQEPSQTPPQLTDSVIAETLSVSRKPFTAPDPLDSLPRVEGNQETFSPEPSESSTSEKEYKNLIEQETANITEDVERPNVQKYESSNKLSDTQTEEPLQLIQYNESPDRLSDTSASDLSDTQTEEPLQLIQHNESLDRLPDTSASDQEDTESTPTGARSLSSGIPQAAETLDNDSEQSAPIIEVQTRSLSNSEPVEAPNVSAEQSSPIEAQPLSPNRPEAVEPPDDSEQSAPIIEVQKFSAPETTPEAVETSEDSSEPGELQTRSRVQDYQSLDESSEQSEIVERQARSQDLSVTELPSSQTDQTVSQVDEPSFENTSDSSNQAVDSLIQPSSRTAQPAQSYPPLAPVDSATIQRSEPNHQEPIGKVPDQQQTPILISESQQNQLESDLAETSSELIHRSTTETASPVSLEKEAVSQETSMPAISAELPEVQSVPASQIESLSEPETIVSTTFQRIEEPIPPPTTRSAADTDHQPIADSQHIELSESISNNSQTDGTINLKSLPTQLPQDPDLKPESNPIVSNQQVPENAPPTLQNKLSDLPALGHTKPIAPLPELVTRKEILPKTSPSPPTAVEPQTPLEIDSTQDFPTQSKADSISHPNPMQEMVMSLSALTESESEIQPEQIELAESETMSLVNPSVTESQPTPSLQLSQNQISLQKDDEQFDQLAQKIYTLLRQRIERDRDRQGQLRVTHQPFHTHLSPTGHSHFPQIDMVSPLEIHLDRLATEIQQQIQQRLELEQERHSYIR